MESLLVIDMPFDGQQLGWDKPLTTTTTIIRSRKTCGIVFLRGLAGMRWHFGVGNSAHIDSAMRTEIPFLFYQT